RFGKRVIFSKPYYFAEYRCVVAAGAASPDEETPLAVERGLALRGIRGRELHEQPGLEGILLAIVEGRERAGYVSAPRGSWLAEQGWPGKLTLIRPEGDAGDRFPICAAVRKTDDDLKTAIDRAFAELAESGKLAEVFAHWHFPYETAIEMDAARAEDK